MRYRNRVAVVTGAGSGIGRALTIALAAGGARVAASDIDADGLAATQAACAPESVTTYRLDVADRAAVFAHAEQVMADLGPASMLFNNAGVDLMANIEDMDPADLDWLFGINFGGVVNGTKAFLPQLVAAGSREHPARLVNLSSAFGLIAVPAQGAYCASKFAVRGLSEALRQEMIMEARPVTVHCVHPGVVKTNFGANMRTSAEDAEIARKLFDKAAMTTPERTARTILRGVDRGKARILVGPDGRIAAALPRLLGVSYTTLFARGSRVMARSTERTPR